MLGFFSKAVSVFSSFLTKSSSCKAYVIILMLSCYCLFIYGKNQNLKEDIAKSHYEKNAWKLSAMQGQESLKILQMRQEEMDKIFLILEEERKALRKESLEKNKELQRLKQENIRVKEWAENEVPEEIQRLFRP